LEEKINLDTEVIRDGDYINPGKKIILGLQHTFTMFGATVLVPIITGFSISVALFMAGCGTLLFYFITRRKVPAFLGSSFAFIAPVLVVTEKFGLPYACGGIVVAGLLYLLLSLLVSVYGVKKILSFFPPVVTGPIIIVIGLKLAPVAIDMAKGNWALALVGFAVVTAVSIYAKGFFKVLPVLTGIFVGYLVAIFTGNVDFTPIAQAKWIGWPEFIAAKFNWTAITIIAPVAVATMVEHVGDVLAIGATVEKNLVEDPGLNRTLIGDGLATSLSAMFGGPANTTYSENTGVLALTRVYHPVIIAIAAVFAILLGLVPKLGAVILTIPSSLIGGISIVLFGMIASIGIRTVVEHKVDFSHSRNLLISAVILVLGLGGAVLAIPLGTAKIEIAGMALGAIIGIILNKILPN
jgi:uracil permease